MLSGSFVTTVPDLTGNGHTLSQATAANRFAFATNVVNGKPVLRAGAPASDCFMSWVDWAAPAQCTIYAVIRVRTTATYQVFIFRDAQATPYIGTQDGDGFDNRPAFYTNAPVAQWGADLVDQTVYLIKWSSNSDTEQCRVQVNNGTEVVQVSGLAFSPGTFKTLGFDQGVVATQDLISDVAEFLIYGKMTNASEDEAVWNHFNYKYRISP